MSWQYLVWCGKLFESYYSYGYSYGSIELWADSTWYDVGSSLSVIIVMDIVMVMVVWKLTVPGMRWKALCHWWWTLTDRWPNRWGIRSLNPRCCGWTRVRHQQRLHPTPCNSYSSSRCHMTQRRQRVTWPITAHHRLTANAHLSCTRPRSSPSVTVTVRFLLRLNWLL